MRPIMFVPRFEQQILVGTKDQTIRAKRKRPYRVGEIVSLRVWTGRPYMTPQREFAQAEITEVIDFDMYEWGNGYAVHVDGDNVLTELDFIGKRDGFSNGAHMLSFIASNHRMPFKGDIYRWKLIHQAKNDKNP